MNRPFQHSSAKPMWLGAILLSIFIFYSCSASACLVATDYSGIDIGDQVNAAYLKLPMYTDKNNQPPWPAGCIQIPYNSNGYNDATTIKINSPFVSLIADLGTVVYYTGSGDFIRIQQSPRSTDNHTFQPAQSTQIVNLNITNLSPTYPSGVATGVSGIHAGDMYGITLRNVSISGFNQGNNSTNGICTNSTAAAIWFDNESTFTEGLDLDHVNTYDNCIGIRYTVNNGQPIPTGSFITDSFGYGEFRRVVLGLRDNETGVSVEEGAYLYHQNWSFVTEANVLTAVGMKLKNVNSTFGGAAAGQTGGDNWIDWRVECPGCGGKMTYLQMDSGTIFRAAGLITALNQAVLSPSNPPNFKFLGTNDTTATQQ